MADIKKEQERAELHKMIWNAATDLVHAGGVDAWDFKQYVLGTMFYRYISENITEYINDGEREAGNESFDYAKMPDEEAETARDGLVKSKGFFMLGINRKDIQAILKAGAKAKGIRSHYATH